MVARANRLQLGAVIAFVAAAMPASAQEAERFAIRCDRLFTMNANDSIFEPGMILVNGGKLEYVGVPIEVPEGVDYRELPDCWMLPGMIDLHSHIHTGGWGDINDMVLPVNPEFRTSPTINPSNRFIRRACAAGVTMLFGIGGSGTSISSFGVLYKTKTDAGYEETVFADPGGMKVAQTHNPERRAGDLGQTRAGLSWILSDINDKARAATEQDRFDLQLENLKRVHTQDLPVLIHCAGNDGVANTVRMWKVKYDTRCVVSHGSFDGWYCAKFCADNGVPVNHGPRTMNYRSGYSEGGKIVGTGHEFVKAGVPNFSLNTDAGVVPQEELFLQGSMSAWLGADSYEMLKAVTIHPARSFNIDDRVGSLEAGKDADVVLWSGDPLDPRSRVELVLIDGRIQYDPNAKDASSKRLRDVPMSLHAILTTAVLLSPVATPFGLGSQEEADTAYEFESLDSQASGILAIQVGVAETMSEAGTMQHAVILVENGKIVMIGEDLPIERGIPVLDKDPEWVVMPGLIDAYSRIGLDSRGGNDFIPTGSILPELYPKSDVYEQVREYGITTLGLYPPGNSVPGQASVVQPLGSTKDEMVLENESYLKIVMESSSRSKRTLRSAWAKVEKYKEKDDKAREKWEKAQSKKKKSKSKSKDKDKDKEADKDDDKGKDEYQSLKPDPEEQVLLDLVAGEKTALVAIRKAADYLHFLDALDDNEIDYALRMPLVRESDFFNVAERIGEAGCRVVFEPAITLHPGTMRQRNLPAEFARAGASLVLIPRADSTSGMRDWLLHTSQLVSAGLDRDVALAALTIEPAKLLGVDERLGSLEKEKVANMVFFNGDPLEVGTRIEAVMIDGKFEFTREEL